jgi:hypothetical protein
MNRAEIFNSISKEYCFMALKQYLLIYKCCAKNNQEAYVKQHINYKEAIVSTSNLITFFTF